MINDEEKIPYKSTIVYKDYNEAKCPMCGKKIKHPYTGQLTPAQLEDDSNSCIWEEVLDENGGTIGYIPICKNLHPFTFASENTKFVHYDLIEVVNNWECDIEEKVEAVKKLIIRENTHLIVDDIIVKTEDNKIISIIIDKPIEKMYIDLVF